MSDKTLQRFPLMYYALILVSALNQMSFNMLTPVLSKYILSLGHTLSLAGVIAGAFSITALVVRPLSGLLTDRVNERMVLLAAIPLYAVSTMGLGLANSVPTLFISRIMMGACFALCGTALTAFACNYIPPARMGEGIGYLGLSYTLCAAVGPGLGATLANHVGYRRTFLYAGFFNIAACVVVYLLKCPFKQAQRKKLALADIIALELLPIALINGLFSFSNGISSNYIVLFSESRAIPSPTLYFSVLAVAMLVVRPIAGKLNDRRGLAAVLIPAFLCSTAGLCLIANMRTLPMLLCAAVLNACGQGAGQPAIQAQCIRELGQARRGVAISTYYIFADLFQGFGVSVGGAISETFGYTATFYVCALLILSGFILFMFLKKTGRISGTVPEVQAQ